MKTWNPRANELFLKALELEPPARQAYLEEACAGDAALRAEVESLLQASDRAGSFLAAPVAALPAPLAEPPGLKADVTLDEAPVVERPGMAIGPYKVLEEIGEGGFGVVFMAEQREPIRRKVALKVLKPGMDTRQVVARFEAERQALALMDHPNIAHILDGGATASGRPYFVMELVKGVPITQFCDQNHLSPRERLELFVSVCQAVQHAHQKGIIHRDLKPSNVLISLHDTKPVVKVIDFGIAKAVGQVLTDKTLFTGFNQMIGTPLYMSPEQAGLSGLDIDTRSDIYSLGVLLYELLTGTTPFDQERLREAGYDEMRRIIREEEPPRPSTRLSTMGDAATPISAQRGSDPKKLGQLLRGELDWIVMKALEKDRNRRYESPSGFAADVQRYLNDEPVLACPPSTWYRFRKFARRNKRAFVSATVALLVVVLALVGLSIGLVAIQREKLAKENALEETGTALKNTQEALKREEKALREARKQRNMALFHLELAQVAVHDCLTSIANNPQLKTFGFHDLRMALLRPSINILLALQINYKDEPELQDYLVEVYSDLAFLRHEIGQDEEALKDYQRAQAVATRLVARFPNGHKYRLVLARSQHDTATLLCQLGRRLEAEPLYKGALGLRKTVFNEGHDVPGARHNMVLTQVCLGLLCSELGRQREALEYYGEALTQERQLVKQYPKSAEYREGLATVLINRSKLFAESNQFLQAEAACLEAIVIQKKLAAELPDHPEYRQQLAMSCGNLGNAQRALKKQLEAETSYRDSLVIQSQLVTDFPQVPQYRQELARTHMNLGEMLSVQGKSSEAMVSFRKSLTLYEDLHKRFPKVPDYAVELAFCCNNVGRLTSIIRPADAVEWFARAITALEPVLAQEKKLVIARETLFRAYRGRADAYYNCKRLTEALKDYDRAIAFADDSISRFLRGERALTLAQLLHERGKQREAADALDEAVKIQTKLVAEFPKDANYQLKLACTWDYLGIFLRDAGNLRQAYGAFRQSLSVCKKLVSDFPKAAAFRSQLTLTLDHLGTILRDTGNPRQAHGAYDEGLSVCQKLVDDFPDIPEYRHQLAGMHNNLGVLLMGSFHDLPGAQKQLREGVTIEEDLVAKFPAETEYIISLAMYYRNLGSCSSQSNQPEAAVGWFSKAIAALEPLLREDALRSDVRESLGIAHWGRAETRSQQGQYKEALPDWDRALKLDNGQNPRQTLFLRFQHALTLARLKKHALASIEADALAKTKDATGYGPYYAARVFAVSSSMVIDSREAGQLSERAVALLRQWTETIPLPARQAARDMLKQDALLAPLRSHTDYQELLKQLEQKKKP